MASNTVPLSGVATAASVLPNSDPDVFALVANFFGLHHLAAVDQHTIKNFRFDVGVTPLSSPLGVALCVVSYFAIIKSLQAWVRARGKPFNLNWFVIVHNSLLSIGSAVLWLSMVAELLLIYNSHGFWSLACDPLGKHVAGPIYFIYFVNYVFKYVELIDTFLLALRGKPIPFLHSYHHAATLVLCWSQLWAQSCIQWLPIVINLLVHVVMYAYYALHAMGQDIWWKKHLTTGQIIQFIVALTGCILAFGSRVASLQLHILPVDQYGCWGTSGGAYVGIAIIASYLYLFIVLYKKMYARKKVAAAKRAETAASTAEKHLTNGHSNGHTPRTIDEAVANGYAKHLSQFEASNGAGRRPHQE